jgi:nucleoside-diphosphate-sugar epimerase
MPRALITGATGLVGSHIVERLHREGWDVRALVRTPSATGWLAEQRTDVVAGDVLDKEAFARAAKGCEVIFHTAAAITPTGGWEDYRSLNLDGTQNAIDAARSAGARLMHVSSVAVYGPGHRYRSGGFTTEDLSLEPLEDDQYYARSKRDSEQMVMAAHARGDIWATAIRPDVIYGRRDRQFIPRIARLLNFRVAPLLGGGKSTMPIINAENVADAAYRAATTDIAGGRVYNVANERPVTVREFFQLAAQGLDRRVVGAPIPIPIARLLLGVAVRTVGILAGRGVAAMSSSTLNFLSRDNPFSSERARVELKWEPPVDPRAGIPDAFRWWKEHEKQKGRDRSRPNH